MKSRIIGLLTLCFVIASCLVCIMNLEASTPEKKASAVYCMTCGCKDPSSVDEAGFSSSKSEPGKGQDGGNCVSITTNAGQYSTLNIPSAVVAKMKGNLCRLSGYYKTTEGKLFDVYGEYSTASQPGMQRLEFNYHKGLGNPSLWQKFEYFYDFENVFDLQNVAFYMRSPDINTQLYIDQIEICTYYKDEPKNLALLSNLTSRNGTLEPTFNSMRISYYMSVVDATATITVTPVEKITGSTIKVNGLPVTSNTESQPITVNTGIDNLVTIDVSAADCTPMKYTVRVGKGVDGRLSNMVLTPVQSSLDPPLFDKNNYSYVAQFNNTVSSITITSTAVDNRSTIKIITVHNGTMDVSSGGTSGSITLDLGDNPITIEVTPPGGTDYKKVYSLNVKRGCDVSLRTLTITDESLNNIPYSPTDLTNNFNLSAVIQNLNVNRVIVTATPTDPDMNVLYIKNGVAVTNPIDIGLGKTEVRIGMGGSGLCSSNLYSINFSKGIDASLASLEFSTGTSGRTDSHNYYDNVDQNVYEIRLKPTVTDHPFATVTCFVNGKSFPITSGVFSDYVALAAGRQTQIVLVVTARDGVTQETYYATVNRGGDSETPTISFSSASAAYYESQTSPSIMVSITPTPQADQTFSIDYAVPAAPNGGTAVRGTDYTLTSGTLTFTSSVTSRQIPITIVPNNVWNEDKTVIIKLSNPSSGAQIGQGNFVYTIVNDDMGNVAYVCKGATSPYDGTSWEHAFLYLQDALAAARVPGSPIREIRVGAGTYYPDVTFATKPNGTGDRTMSFDLVSGVTLLGGYPFGGGDTRNSNPETNGTILSGDIDQNGDLDENSYHIVTSPGNTTIDGFTLKDGNALIRSGDENFNYGGAYFSSTGANTIKNCFFSRNHSSVEGGALYLQAASLTMEGCTFSNNKAYSAYGGAVSLKACTASRISKCTFDNNDNYHGGAVGYLSGSGENTIENTVFFNNGTSACMSGGAVDFGNTTGSLTVNSCSFSKNNVNSLPGSDKGGAIYCESGCAPVTIINSIFWYNTSINGRDVFAEPGVTLNISYSDLQQSGFAPANNNESCVPWPDPATPAAMKLTAGSNCSKNTANKANVPLDDRDGVARGAYPDKGAYENNDDNFNPTITFDSQGGSSVSSQTVSFGGLVTQPTAPTRNGYTFGGWYKETACTNTWNFSSDAVNGNTTLYAKWTVVQYTVTFNSQGGSSVTSQTVSFGGLVTQPTAPTRSCYTFGGWYKESACTNAWNFSSDAVNGNTTVYAKWTSAQYTVTFNSQGGSSVSSQTINCGGLVTQPTAPTRSCYTFGGWYKESGCTNAWNFSTDVVNGNTTVYAKWTSAQYTVTFNSQGGSSVSIQTISCGGLVTQPTAPTRSCYTFGGWYKESGCTNAWNFSTDVINGNSTIYAKWTSITYTVLFDSRQGSSVSSQTINCGGLVTQPTAPTLSCYTFVGWYKESDCINVWNFSTDVVNDKKMLYAKWTIIPFTVTFNSQGGSSVSSQTINCGGLVTQPTAPTRSCYTFGGWYKESGCTNAWNFSSDAVNGNTTVYAKWTASPYTITFNANGGTGTMSNQTIGCGSSANLTSNAFTRNCYFFAGWATSSTGSVAYKNGESYTIGSSNVTLYAVWTQNSYSITFNANGGTGTMSNQTIGCGSSANLTSNAFTRSCYSFAGWATSSTGSAAYANGANYTMGSSNVTLYAVWTLNQYTVTFNSQSGSSVTSQTINCGGLATQPTAPTRSCYTFGGWYKESGCTNAWNFSTDVVNATTTIYAKWTIIPYTVTFNSQGGSSVTSQSVNCGALVTQPTAPTRSCYTFGGWYKESACTNAWNFSSGAVNGNTTLYAKWTLNSYSITFNANGGTGTMSSQTIGCGSSANLTSNAFTRSCYSFAGWATSSTGSAAYANGASYTMGSSNVTLYVVWTQNRYTVTFNSQGGSSVTLQTINCGGLATQPTAPTRSCYTFGGWYKESGCTNAWNFSTDVVNATTTVYAKWTIIPYTVTFNSQGGSSVTSKSVNCGSLVTQPTAPTRSCYTFGGWYKESACTNAWNFSTGAVNGNTTLYAKWTQPSYTLATNAPNGSISKSPNNSSYACGTSVTLTATPFAGFRFSSWSGDASGTNASVTITMNSNKSVTANFVRRRLYVDNKLSTVAGVVYDGSSWANAFHGDGALDRAMDAAELLGPSGKDEVEIWVATDQTFGVSSYIPTRNYDGDGDPRNKSFKLRPYVKLYGGFKGGDANETVENRQMSLTGNVSYMVNESWLSGDLAQNDPWFLNDGGSEYSENVYHVVTGCDNATIDGFTIRSGNANSQTGDANGIGAGMYNLNASPTVKNCIFKCNWAYDAGGAIFNDVSNPSFENCIVSGNYAMNGAGIYEWHSNSSITKCEISDNSSYNIQAGGGIYFNNSASQISNSWINSNYSAGDGGGIYNNESSITVDHCNFTYNNAEGSGAGIYKYIFDNTCLINGCIFNDNYASLEGGGICEHIVNTSVGSVTINNCLFSYNSGMTGSAICDEQGNLDITNCTIVNNTAPGSGGSGGINNGYGKITIRNSIIYGNLTNQYYEISSQSSNTVTSYSFISGSNWNAHYGTDGGNNKYGDPLINDSYTLKPGSPCINTGTTGSGISNVDILGHTRIGNPDRGAYEYGY